MHTPRRSENEAALLFNNLSDNLWALKVTWILNVLGRK
ncbi:hypothetical protein BANRA_02114 [Klebsiella pneumoniae]|nr:hypothetical protein BANRA_03316 [Klebsiella pneumoniae]VDA86474.1 hypothetical protein BANRA_02114 [Klebsiella pneumoniae]